MNYDKILQEIYDEIIPLRNEGRQADYIPALAEVNPDQYGVCLCLTDGTTHLFGDARTPFSIQSISKVFSLAVALSYEGPALWQRVGKEPSGAAFNSIVQLEFEDGIPRNPFINAGAIVCADVMLSHCRDAEAQFLDFVRALSGCPDIEYNRRVAQSEEETGYLNAAIVNLLKSHGNINNDIQDVLHLYSTMCALEMSCEQLARAFLCFARSNEPFDYAGIRLTTSKVKRINAIMQTCGFYDEAGEFSFRVGLPGKSGVGGGIAAIYPSRYAITVWSPRLNTKGNSIMGMKALELFTTMTKESIF